MRRILPFLALATFVTLGPQPAKAGDPIPEIDVIIVQIPGGTIKYVVGLERVDEVWIEVPPGMFSNDAVALPPGWFYGRFSDGDGGLFQLVGEPTDEAGVEIIVTPPPGSPIFPTQVSVRQTTERWTPWLDRDNPSGGGDFETLTDFVAAGLDCPNPVAIECQTVDRVPHEEAGQVYSCDLELGGICLNADNRKPSSLFAVAIGCLDYRVRFRCSQ